MSSNSVIDFTSKFGYEEQRPANERSRIGVLVAGGFGFIGATLVLLATPFILPALRKHCLPYVPATDVQLANLSKAFKKHSRKGETFLDIGSGDGRICRMAAEQGIYSQIHGVELNYMLVLFSRLISFKLGNRKFLKYHHSDLWRFRLSNYDAISIFGVESMMDPLGKYLKESSHKQQTIYACRFPFKNLDRIDELGSGIDTVWVYRLTQGTPEKNGEDVNKQ